jgi:hypothetical protein
VTNPKFETIATVVARWQRDLRQERQKPPTRTSRSRPLSMTPTAVRSRDKRSRRNRHVTCHMVEVTGEVYDLLVRLGWLTEADLTNKLKVNEALSRLLQDAAKR